MSEMVLRAHRPGSRIRRPKRYEIDRVCIAEGCTTVMSMYNRGDHCFRHRPVTYPRVRGLFTDEYAAGRD